MRGISSHEIVGNLRINSVFIQVGIIGEMLSQAGNVYRIADDGGDLSGGQSPFKALRKDTFQPVVILPQGFALEISFTTPQFLHMNFFMSLTFNQVIKSITVYIIYPRDTELGLCHYLYMNSHHYIIN